MIRTLVSFLVAASLTGVTRAQMPMNVVPPGAATLDQNAAYTPLALHPNRQQIFYTVPMLSSLPSTRVTSIAWRPDRIGASGTVTATLSLRLSSQGLPAPDDASRIDPNRNLGSDATWVARDVLVTFPAVSPVSSGQPRGTWITIPLQQPFDYVAGRPLMVEVTFQGPPALGYALDASRRPTTPWSADVTTFSSPCASAGTVSHDLRTTTSGRPVFQPYYEDPRLGSVTTGAFGVGFSRTLWNGLSLPVPLDAAGAPGCEIASSLDILLPLQVYSWAGGTVYYTTVWPPRDPNFVGATFYVQGFLFDSTINALGMLATPSWQIDVTAGPQPLQGLVLTFTSSAVAIESPELVPVLGLS